MVLAPIYMSSVFASMLPLFILANLHCSQDSAWRPRIEGSFLVSVALTLLEGQQRRSLLVAISKQKVELTLAVISSIQSLRQGLLLPSTATGCKQRLLQLTQQLQSRVLQAQTFSFLVPECVLVREGASRQSCCMKRLSWGMLLTNSKMTLGSPFVKLRCSGVSRHCPSSVQLLTSLSWQSRSRRRRSAVSIADLRHMACLEAFKNKNIQLVIMPSSSTTKEQAATQAQQFRNSVIYWSYRADKIVETQQAYFDQYMPKIQHYKKWFFGGADGRRGRAEG